MTRPLAIILLGGIRELSAAILEDSGDIHDLTEVAIQAATALLRPPAEPRAQALAPDQPRG
jgi:hypothetical protein